MLRSALVFLFAACHTVAAMGVAYDTYNAKDIDKHFRSIKTRFSAVRTYQTYLWNPTRNAIDAASDNNLPIYAGIWLRNGMDYNAEVNAVIDGCKRHGDIVKAVFVGNEDISNGWNQWQVRDKVNDVRGRLRAAGINVRVGTVQTDGDWLNNPDLANACDIMGVNIYAFFGGSPNSWNNPISDLDARWNQMTNKFGGNKLLLTETGWPFGGGNNGNHVSNWGNAVDYFNKVNAWSSSKGGENPIYFMYHDNPNKGGYEAQFGVANANGDYKFDFSATTPGSGGGNDDKPSGQFQLITNRGKALREWYGGVAAKDNNWDGFTKWTYDANTQQIKNYGANKCLDAYMDGNNVKVHVYDCDGNNSNQKWRLSGAKVIHARFNNICLDADVNDSNEAAQVWWCVDNNTNQIFKIGY
ncbi:hypothetical protein SDRG_13011 [Saprolegnia diclina VS20]|uniref:glucan endo-1,3-beta-D-glucosidase n=1 Tax=Saprolegnia diclina (strain VS20) TaxID=1156394 RepID=T0RHQ2_SAPDV|nr:hypothetical protein SDRG_13011 [Saprolegnia diclina VS20]EQC29342.1 hypothetical protein SDRG_13011 [Saprolegnia diclina VS20]|eukprot:XP_008617316.1 hypothetical protein SDRG_13011 [Saprolegnia diclina VS20]